MVELWQSTHAKPYLPELVCFVWLPRLGGFAAEAPWQEPFGFVEQEYEPDAASQTGLVTVPPFMDMVLP